VFRFTHCEKENEVRVNVIKEACEDDLFRRINLEFSHQFELTTFVLGWRVVLLVRGVLGPVDFCGGAAKEELTLFKGILEVVGLLLSHLHLKA
jgi:hypothetical protein